jgi:hypothetical protein
MEKYDACHSIASPDTLVHVSPFTGYDFSPVHRPLPFFQRFSPRMNLPSEKVPWTEAHRLPGNQILFLQE